MVLGWALWTRRPLNVARHERKPLFYLGCLFAVQLAFMNIGQDFTTAGHAVVITTTFPLWTGLLAHFYVPGDRLSKGRFAGAMVAYAGVVVLFSRGIGNPGGFLIGDFLLLVSAILLGARQVYMSNSLRGIEPHKLLLSQSVVGTVTFVTASLILEPDPYIWTGRLILALAYQGVVIAGFGVHRQHLAVATLPAIEGLRRLAYSAGVRSSAELVGAGRGHRTGTLRRRSVGHRRIVHGAAGRVRESGARRTASDVASYRGATRIRHKCRTHPRSVLTGD